MRWARTLPVVTATIIAIAGTAPVADAQMTTPIVVSSPTSSQRFYLPPMGQVKIPVTYSVDCTAMPNIRFAIKQAANGDMFQDTKEFTCGSGGFISLFTDIIVFENTDGVLVHNNPPNGHSCIPPSYDVCFSGWYPPVPVNLTRDPLPDPPPDDPPPDDPPPDDPPPDDPPPDETAPTIDITAPPDGGEYVVGQTVAANYSCSDGTGSGVASCSGPVADGALIDTATAGEKTFQVTAVDEAGNTATRTHDYTVAELVPVAKTSRSRDDPLKVSFDASESKGRIEKWEWDFGDGKKGEGEKVDHVYPDGGERKVTLKVTDRDGNKAEREVVLEKCTGTLRLGPVALKGCAYEFPDRWVAVGQVRINGLDVIPVGEAKVVVDLNPLRLSAVGAVRVKAGDLTLFEGEVAWQIAGGPIVLQSPEGADFAGFPLTGGITIEFNAADGGSVDITMGAKLTGFEAVGVLPDQAPATTGEIKVRGNVEEGLFVRSAKLKAEHMTIGPARAPVAIRGFNASYERVPQGDLWTGGAEIGPPLGPVYEGKVTFLNGRFVGAGYAFDDLNVPLPTPPGIFFQRAGVEIVTAPHLQVSGEAAVSLGPSIRGVSAWRADGRIGYESNGTCKGRSTRSPTFSLSGKQTFVTLEGPTGYVCWQLDGNLISAGLEFKSHEDEAKEAGWHIEGSLDGFVDGTSALTLIGLGTLRTPFDEVPGVPRPPAAHRARMVASEVGFGACYEGHVGLAAPGPNGESGNWLRYGIMWRWGEVPHPGCDLEAFHTLKISLSRRSLRAAARADASTTLPAGLPGAAFAVAGEGGPPALRLTGPAGVRIVVADVTRASRGKGWLAVPDRVNSVTYVILTAPAGGRWSVAATGGSKIRKVDVARGLPAPQVFGSVSADGDARVLKWTADAVPGQRIRFFEEGEDVARLIGETTAASGTIRFVPAGGTSSARRITALVEQDGVPRDTVEVAAFVADAAAPSDTAAPVLSGLSVRPGKVRAPKGRGASALRAGGTTVRFKLSEQAAVHFEVERQEPGVRRGKKCVAAHGKLPKGARPCKRWRAAKGAFTQAGRAGENSFGFTGRMGGKPLAPGTYRLAATPTDLSGNPGRTTTAAVRVVAR